MPLDTRTSPATIDDAASVRYITMPTMTKWRNPTTHVQKVQVRVNGRVNTITWQPGETKEISSEFNIAVHKVRCSESACRQFGDGFCREGHPGSVCAGQAPLLVRVGVDTTLAPGLDPNVAVKKQAEADLAAATLTARMVSNQATLAAELLTRPAVAAAAEPEPAAAPETPAAPLSPPPVPTLGGKNRGG